MQAGIPYRLYVYGTQTHIKLALSSGVPLPMRENTLPKLQVYIYMHMNILYVPVCMSGNFVCMGGWVDVGIS